MLKISASGEEGTALKDFGYAENTGWASRFILPITRWMRMTNAKRYVLTPAERLIDIGCGDGYFLRRLDGVGERYGLDMKSGDEVRDVLNFPNDYFDYVTMLAVIEHLSDPQSLLKEIARVLKPDGHLIVTTPKKKAEYFIRFYAKDIEDEHETYFTQNTISRILPDSLEIETAHNFIFGLNQAFCILKKS